MARRCRGAGGQPPLNLHLIDAQGQTAHQPFFLLEVRRVSWQLYFCAILDAWKHIVIQLAGIVRRVHNQERYKNIRSFRLCKSCKSFLASAP